MSLTPAQGRALAARGNVLVSAGAGTGKTRTLVERCVGCLLAATAPASLEEILVVTFTEAAAAEMRQRIRTRLQEESARNPDVSRWAEQLALFETAQIGTLHSFCLRLIRQHFYELELDPQLTVLAEEEAWLLAGETLDQLFREHYSGRAKPALSVQQLLLAQGRGGDQAVRTLVLRLHHYTQTRADPAAWFETQIDCFADTEPRLWREWLRTGLGHWLDRGLRQLKAQAAQNQLAGDCADLLGPISAGVSPENASAILEKILALPEACPRGKKTLWVKPLEDFFDEANFLHSLVRKTSQADPLAEDWGWVRNQMATLLELSRSFSRAFTEAKRDLGMVDFHDLEQYALRLLWDPHRQQPSPIAQRWREQLRFVLVDEYQDINGAQDKIIRALSRDGESSNRFLVGDVKQSIYRFRLADPTIFLGYLQNWRGAGGQVVALVENFRSREGLLQFVNSLFGTLMQPELSDIAYDEQARLLFGDREQRAPLSAAPQPEPCVELHLRLKRRFDSAEHDLGSADVADGLAELEEAEKEARLVGLRLSELKAMRLPVWDETKNAFRPVDWADMAILLRAPANKAEGYAKEFARLGVPLQVSRSGFYQSLEISDLLSLLQVLDNPLQDLPLLAVLRSPLVGLALEELATIRLAAPKGPYWAAVVRWLDLNQRQARDGTGPREGQTPKTAQPHRGAVIPEPDLPTTTTSLPLPDSSAGLANAETLRKVALFMGRFGRWRRLARQASLSHCLEAILAETHYADWLLTQARGQQRHAQVRRLLGLAHRFDQFQRQGLFRFLRFVDAQRSGETEPVLESLGDENSVRLMSIHQSKGLEFPVVVVADLAKPFNLNDLRQEVILDEEYGLCPQVKPPHSSRRYPSLPYWLARPGQHRQLLGEELRLLYVALTRARDRLLLVASIPDSKFRSHWNQKPEALPPALSNARSCADWLGSWFALQSVAARSEAMEGETTLLRWRLHDERKLLDPVSTAAPAAAPAQISVATLSEWRRLEQRLAWRYPFIAAAREPAKTSVTRLRHQASEDDEEAAIWGDRPSAPTRAQGEWGELPGAKPAADVGTIHHRFLQFVSLERVDDDAQLEAEAKRLVSQSVLRAEEVEMLDYGGLAAFWSSDLGVRVKAQSGFLERELPFTARFSPNELAALLGQNTEPSLVDEFLLVQGIADLVVLEPKQIWLIDFKTDRVGPEGPARKAHSYAPQLRLYARALTRIYKKPVSGAWLYFLSARSAVSVELD